MQTSDNLADVQSANPLDRFSMARVKMVIRYYYPLFRKQLWVYPLVGILVGVLFHLREFLTIFDVFFGLLTLAMSFMVYWAPLVLTGKDRTTEILLPARWSEKALVLMVYFLVVIPLLIQGAYYLSNGLITFLRTGAFMVDNHLTTETFEHLSVSQWLGVPLAYLNMIFPVAIFLFIVCRSPRPKAWQGMLFSVLSSFAFGITIGVYVIVTLISNLSNFEFDNIAQPEVERIVFQTIDFDALTFIMTSALALGTIVFIALTIRSIRKVQA